MGSLGVWGNLEIGCMGRVGRGNRRKTEQCMAFACKFVSTLVPLMSVVLALAIATGCSTRAPSIVGGLVGEWGFPDFGSRQTILKANPDGTAVLVECSGHVRPSGPVEFIFTPEGSCRSMMGSLGIGERDPVRITLVSEHRASFLTKGGRQVLTLTKKLDDFSPSPP